MTYGLENVSIFILQILYYHCELAVVAEKANQSAKMNVITLSFHCRIMRKILGNFYFIHFLVLLGLFAQFGWIMTDSRFLLLGVACSFAGAICGAFIRVIDRIEDGK